MKEMGYAWEALPVKTEDNYQLTLFHLIGSFGEGKFRPDKPPVLIVHGLY